jgi:hypothetical protein
MNIEMHLWKKCINCESFRNVRDDECRICHSKLQYCYWYEYDERAVMSEIVFT